MATSMKEVRGYVRQKAKEAEAWGALEKQLSQFHDLEKAVAYKQREVEALEADVAKVKAGRDGVLAEQAKILAGGRAEVERMKSDAKNEAYRAQERSDNALAALASDLDKAAAGAKIVDKQASDTREAITNAQNSEKAIVKREVAMSAREAAFAAKEADLAETKGRYEAELARIQDFAKGVRVA